MDGNLVCFRGKNRLFNCIFKTFMDENLVCVFKAKIDYFTVFSRPKFMDENLVCVFKPKIDYFTYF